MTSNETLKLIINKQIQWHLETVFQFSFNWLNKASEGLRFDLVRCNKRFLLILVYNKQSIFARTNCGIYNSHFFKACQIYVTVTSYAVNRSFNLRALYSSPAHITTNSYKFCIPFLKNITYAFCGANKLCEKRM